MALVPAALRFVDDVTTVILTPDSAGQVVVQIENAGSLPGTVNDLSAVAGFVTPAVSFSAVTPLTVGPGETAELTLNIGPAAEGSYLALMTLTSDGTPGEDSASLDSHGPGLG